MTSAFYLRTVCAVAAAAILAACGGGGSTQATPSSSPAKAAPQAVTFRFDVPASSSSAKLRHPQYVSPATQYMLVDIQTGCPGACAEVSGYPQTVGLTTTSTGCTSTLASTSCQLTLSLPPGSYTASFTTQDASHAALSGAQSIAFTVVAGAANTISLTLSGVPVFIRAAALAPGSSAFAVNVYDADNNVIVGAGAPTISVAATSGIAVTLTQPSSASPNVFRAVSTATGTAALTVTAAYPSGTTNACTLSGAVCSQAFTLTSSPVLVADTSASGNANALYLFDGTTLAMIGTLPIRGLTRPVDIVFDNAGNLWAIGPTQFAEYAPPYTGAPLVTVTTHNNDVAIAVDASDDVFTGGTFNQGISEWTPPSYTAAPTKITVPSGSATTLAVAPNGDLLSGDNDVSPPVLSVFTSPYSAAPATQTFPVGVNSLVVTANGQAYFGSGSIIQLGSSYTGTGGVYTANTYQAGAVTAVNAGDIWAYDSGSFALEHYTPYNGGYTFTAGPYIGDNVFALAVEPGVTSLSIK